MEYGTLNAFLTAIGFKINILTQRFLQEKGVAQADTYAVYRYALIPAIIWSLIFIRPSDINSLLYSPKLLIILAVGVVLWNTQGLIMSQVVNSTDSMVLFTTIFNMLLLPLFLAFGVVFNHDTPNIYNIASIAALLVALTIKPTPHKENLRPRLSKPLYVVLLLILAKACCDTVLVGTYRAAMQEVHPTIFLGYFSVTTLSACALITKLYIKPRVQKAEAINMQQKQWLAITLMPLVWFAASIAEAFSVAAIPIYTFISIGVVTLAMDTVSDLIHHRIRASFQTVCFILLVTAGISLSILSV